MKILQLIDSLRPGGAEQMAVSYANALASRIEGSFLCCTRKEGLLREKLSQEVGYLFLAKKSSLDFKAFFRLRRFVQQNNINLIQAHSSSFFLAVLVKWSLPEVKVVWHDHFGRDLDTRRIGLLKNFSKHFDGIISVNPQLKDWARQQLNTEKLVYIPNFLSGFSSSIIKKSGLKGLQGFKIVCVANFRPQKDHLNLLRAFSFLTKKKKNLSLHLIGKMENDSCLAEIKRFISEYELEKDSFLYGEQREVESFLKDADLAVLSSSSEGLPVALLEYGRAGLPVVCTEVGECPTVIGGFGELVPPKNPEALASAINYYIENEIRRKKDAACFQEKVLREFSEEVVMKEVLGFYGKVME